MKVIFAQGNPGTRYVRTRHNVGFAILDTFASDHSAEWKKETKFQAEVATLSIQGEKVLLVKPTTFYNETGRSARAIIDFYKLSPATDFLVLHDELALPFGTVRIREKGSDAGNNGIKSLNAHLGPEYARIRVGVWSELRNQMDDAAFVLSSFTQEEAKQLHTLTETKITQLLNDFIRGSLEVTSHTI